MTTSGGYGTNEEMCIALIEYCEPLAAALNNLHTAD